MPKRLILRGLVAAGVVTTLVWLALGDAEPALVEGVFPQYHYAGQWTAYNEAYYTPSTGSFGEDAYHGWIGVNGRLRTPSSVPDLPDPDVDHANGALAVTNAGLVEVGWYTGTGGGGAGPCSNSDLISRIDNMGMFHFWCNESIPYARLYDLGGLNLGENVIYRVDRHSSAGCWNVFIRYNDLVNTVCLLPYTASPNIWSEVYGIWPLDMELSYFGWPQPNTNNALRLRGACSQYEPWDTTLCARRTSYFDEPYTYPLYHIYHYNRFHYFKTYDTY